VLTLSYILNKKSRRRKTILSQNICHFIPFHKDSLSIHTINFVYETEPQIYGSLQTESVYKMHYVCSGQGVLHTTGKITTLKEGDIFFTFPASPFRIESGENFTYMYISFIGSRGNMIMDKLKVSQKNFLFSDCQRVYHLWKEALHVHPNLSDLMSESVLLYTFSVIGEDLIPPKPAPKSNDVVKRIKKCIDDNYTCPDFSIEHISRELSYNKKYISHIFKKEMGISIIEYVNTIRIQTACTMMEQNFTSVSDIAARCGYSDPQYFSRIFRQKMGVSPMAYIKALHKAHEE